MSASREDAEDRDGVPRRAQPEANGKVESQWSQILALGRAMSEGNGSADKDASDYAARLAPLLYGAQLISSLQTSRPNPHSGVAEAAAEDAPLPLHPFTASSLATATHTNSHSGNGGAAMAAERSLEGRRLGWQPYPPSTNSLRESQEQPAKRTRLEQERPPPGNEGHSRGISAMATSTSLPQLWSAGATGGLSAERSMSPADGARGRSVEDVADKKLRRKQSNRESARRSRLRKAEGEERKQAEIEALTETLLRSEQANKQLRLEMAKLEARLEETQAKLEEAQRELQKS